MVNPVGSGHQVHNNQATHTPHPLPPERKPPTTEVKDKVTLHRTGDVDHDGDSK